MGKPNLGGKFDEYPRRSRLIASQRTPGPIASARKRGIFSRACFGTRPPSIISRPIKMKGTNRRERGKKGRILLSAGWSNYRLIVYSASSWSRARRPSRLKKLCLQIVILYDTERIWRWLKKSDIVPTFFFMNWWLLKLIKKRWYVLGGSFRLHRRKRD